MMDIASDSLRASHHIENNPPRRDFVTDHTAGLDKIELDSLSVATLAIGPHDSASHGTDEHAAQKIASPSVKL